MRIHRLGFNLYLVAALTFSLGLGCSSTGKKRRMAALTVHMEADSGQTRNSKPVPIYRGKPIMVNVEHSPFLKEGLVDKAEVIEVVGGFALQITFVRRGAWLLEQYTTANRGRRMAIQADFADPADPNHKKRVTRWIAAPLITHRIGDGVLTFTPDATREEADEIVLGLNNLSKKMDDSFKW